METGQYINEFFYFTARKESGVMQICSGVNMGRLRPIVSGRYGIGGNPVKSGLNLVNEDFCAMAHAKGALPSLHNSVKEVYHPQEAAMDMKDGDCAVIAPTKDSWYVERLRIDNANGISADEIVRAGAMNLLRRIASCANMMSFPAPDALPSAEEAQEFLERLCKAMPGK